MKRAVMITNNITEKIFIKNLLDGAEKQIILPNSPEGDAYTFYIEHKDAMKLRTHLRKLAVTIQLQLEHERGEGKLAIKAKEESTPPYIGQIFLRIGIAVSDTPPDEYKYKTAASTTVTSYRGGVIHYSEVAEREAPYEMGFGEWDGTRVVSNTSYAEKYVNDDGNIDSEDKDYHKTTHKSTVIAGFMIFIQYGLLYDPKYAKAENAELNKIDQYEQSLEYHERALDLLERNTRYSASVVKLKRDEASMFFVEAVPERRSEKINTVNQQMVDLYLRMCRLMSSLPAGSSIGICYSSEGDKKLEKIVRTTFDAGEKIDYFGPAVNVAARMEMSTISHLTSEGISKPLLPDSRVAIALFDKEMFNYIVKTLIGEQTNQKQRTTVDFGTMRLQLSDINAGDGNLFVVWSALRGTKFRKGDTIQFYDADKKRDMEDTIKDIFPNGQLKTIKGKYVLPIDASIVIKKKKTNQLYNGLKF